MSDLLELRRRAGRLRVVFERCDKSERRTRRLVLRAGLAATVDPPRGRFRELERRYVGDEALSRIRADLVTALDAGDRDELALVVRCGRPIVAQLADDVFAGGSVRMVAAWLLEQMDVAEAARLAGLEEARRVRDWLRCVMEEAHAELRRLEDDVADVVSAKSKECESDG